MSRLFRFSFVLALLLVPLAAIAQVDPNDPASVIVYAAQAIAGRNWALAAGAAVVLIVFGLRTYGSKWVPWFATDRGGATMVLAVAVLPVIGTALLSGHFNFKSVFDGVLLAFVSAGGFGLVKKLLAPSDKNQPTPSPSP